MEQIVAAEMEEKELDEGDKKAYDSLLAKQKARVNKLLNDMKAALSSTLIRYRFFFFFCVESVLDFREPV